MTELQRAMAILEDAKNAALSHPATYKTTHDGFKAVTETLAAIQDRMQATRATNPDWSCLPELACKLVLLWECDPQSYRALVLPIAPTDQVTLDSLGGMLTLNTILGGLSDDHDYSLDPDADKPRLVLQHELREFAPTIRPIHLLNALNAAYFNKDKTQPSA